MEQTSDTSRSVFRATIVVLVMTMASRLLGFVRDAVIAWAFGASASSDAYMVAYTLPYFLQTVLGAALVTVMIPIVSRYLVAGQEETAWSVTSTIINIMTVFFAVVTVAGMLGSSPLIRILAPEFNPEQADLAAQLTRIMFPSLVFVGLGMLVSGILNAGNYFSLPAIAPGIANLLMILAVVFFSRHYFIASLAWGTLAGFAAFLLIQLPNLKGMGFRYRWHWNLHHPDVERVIRHVPTVLLAISVSQIYLAINRFLASGLPQGSITALDLANRVAGLPLGIFVTSLSTALFPAMSRQAARQQINALGESTAKSLTFLLAVVIPLTALTIAFREPIIRILFQRGVFDATDTWLTATALLYFSLGMTGIAYNLVLTRTCYAMGDVVIPVAAAIISIVIDIAASLPLVRLMGHGGLALANSVATTVNAAVILLMLRPKLPQLSTRRLFSTAWRTMVALIPALLLIGLGLNLWPPRQFNLIGVILQTAGLTAAALAIFTAMAGLLHLPELRWAAEGCLRLLRRKSRGEV